MRVKCTSILTLIFVLFFNITSLYSQQVIPSKGKTFWCGFMNNAGISINGGTLNIAIASDRNTSGTISIPKGTYSQAFNVTANVTTTISIPILDAHHVLTEVADNKGILIQANDTVSVFGLNIAGYSSDGFKVLPIQTLGTGYRIASYTGIANYNSEFLIVATEDNTQIEINPKTITRSGRPANTPFTITLDRGESYQVQASSTAGDFTGTTIVATDSSGPCRPFAVFSGTQCSNVPSNCTACDHIEDQAMPTKFWGKEYILVPFSADSNYTNTYTYRIMAQENSTQFTINGGIPINLSAGQFWERNGVTTPLCISATKPVAAIQYMEGITCTGGLGDPAMVYLNPSDQMIDNITFTTINSPGNVITRHDVTVIMKTADVGKLVLDGVNVPSNKFTSISNCNTYSTAHIGLSSAVGSHTLDGGGAKFIAYIYGVGRAESYVFSGGSFSSNDSPSIDTAICNSDSVFLEAPAGLNNYIWVRLGDTLDTLGRTQTLELYAPIIPDVYKLTADAFISGCSKEYLYVVEVPTPPNLVISASSDTICRFEQPIIEGVLDQSHALYNFEWSPPGYVENPTLAKTKASPYKDTWYTLKATSLGGCAEATDSIFVKVKPGYIKSINITEASQDTVLCIGDSIELNGNIEQIFYEAGFEDGKANPIWLSIAGGDSSNVCGTSAGQFALFFNGAGARAAQTIDLDVSNGGRLYFDLKVSTGAAPCDDAEIGEDIAVEYSINSGGAWSSIVVLNEAAYPNFKGVTVEIPIGAKTSSTRFRIRQLTHSGLDEDTWSIDEFMLTRYHGQNVNITWTPTNDLFSPNSMKTKGVPLTDRLYFLTVIDTAGLCDYNDSVQILVNPYPIVDIGMDLEVCSPDTVVLDAGNPGEDYLWNTLATTQTIEVTGPGTYNVAVTNQFDCTSYDTAVVLYSNPPNPNIGPDVELCIGESVTFSANVPNRIYQWSTGGSNEMITANQVGVYSVIVSDTFGCIGVDTVEITEIWPLPIKNLGRDTVKCPGIVLTLDAGSPGSQYNWNNGATTQIINVGTAGLYHVTVTDVHGCLNYDTVLVEDLNLPYVDLGIDSLTICDGSTYEFNVAYQNTFYRWHNGSTGNKYTATQPEIVTIEAYNRCGVDRDTAKIYYDDCQCDIYFPSAFTPDGNGKNDVFKPVMSCELLDYTLHVYNRWGELVFVTASQNHGWDGLYKNMAQPIQTFMYVVTFTGYEEGLYKTTKRLTGNVTLLR